MKRGVAQLRFFANLSRLLCHIVGFFLFKEFRVEIVLFRAVDLLHVKTGSFSLNGRGISIIPSFP